MVVSVCHSARSLESILERERILITPCVRDILGDISTLDEARLHNFCVATNSIPRADGFYSVDQLKDLYARKLVAGIYFGSIRSELDSSEHEMAKFGYYDAAKWAIVLSDQDSDGSYLWRLRAAICSYKKAELCDNTKQKTDAFFGYVYATRSMVDVLRAVSSAAFDAKDHGWPRKKLIGFFRDCVNRATELKIGVEIRDDKIFGLYRIAVGYFEKLSSRDGSLRPGFIMGSDLDSVVRTNIGDEPVLGIPEITDFLRSIKLDQPFGISSFDMQTRTSFEIGGYGAKSRNDLRDIYVRRLIAAIVYGESMCSGSYDINLRDAHYAYEKSAAVSYYLVDVDPGEGDLWRLRSMILRGKGTGFARGVGRLSDAMFSHLCSLEACMKLIDRVDGGLSLPGWPRKRLVRKLKADFYDMSDLVQMIGVKGCMSKFYNGIVAEARNKHNL